MRSVIIVLLLLFYTRWLETRRGYELPRLTRLISMLSWLRAVHAQLAEHFWPTIILVGVYPSLIVGYKGMQHSEIIRVSPGMCKACTWAVI